MPVFPHNVLFFPVITAEQLLNLCVIPNNTSFLADVDTIQEFTDILPFNCRRLLDQGGYEQKQKITLY